jgi:hypothetical protein
MKEKGQGLVEYALILMLVAVVVIVFLSLLGGCTLFDRDKPYRPRVYYEPVESVIIQDVEVSKTNNTNVILPNTRFAIYDFESPEDTEGGALASDTFASVLRQDGFDVFERDQIERILTEQDLILNGDSIATDIEVASRLSALETIDYMIFGAVTLYQSEGQAVFRPILVKPEDIASYVDDYNSYRDWYVNGFRPFSPDYWTLSEAERIDKLREELEVLSLEEFQDGLEDSKVQEYRTVASIGISVKVIDVVSGEIVWMGQAETTDLTLVGGTRRVVEALVSSLIEKTNQETSLSRSSEVDEYEDTAETIAIASSNQVLTLTPQATMVSRGQLSTATYIPTLESTITSSPTYRPIDIPATPTRSVPLGDGNCPPYDTQLTISDVIVSNDALNVRSGPGTDFDVVASLAPGADARIEDGPICSEDWIWWELILPNGESGWSVEIGTGGIYLLLPEGSELGPEPNRATRSN